MKIAILTSGILPVPAVQGGAVENLIDFYLEYNNKYHLHDITIYSVWHPDVRTRPELESPNNHYHYLKGNNLLSRIMKKIYYKINGNEYYHYAIEFFLHKAIKDIRNKKFDLILIENRPGYVLKLKKFVNTKIVIHQENNYLNSTTLYCQEIYNDVSLIINASDYLTNQVKTINANDTKCRTVLNGIDTNHFFISPISNREENGLKKDDFVIVFSGRLTPEKGILPLIQAIKSLDSISNLKLLIIGANAYGRNQHTTPFIDQLLQESEPIKDKVLFTGYIDYKEIPSYLKMADIAVLPSMWEEPFGLTVVEAMSAGLPLITTRSGGIPEICEGFAMIVDKENIVENLTNTIRYLYNNPEKRKQMASDSLDHAKLFDKEIFARNFFNKLENIT